MSSPLSWFRKNQKLLLGFFGVMLMIVFTLTAGSVGVDELLGLMPGGGGSSGSSQREVAASWSGGTLYESDMQFMRFNRARLAAFMQSALQIAFQRGGRPTMPGIPLGDSDQALVETRLLAERARDMGLIVNDEAVLEFLLAFTGNVVDRSQLVAILRTSSGRPMTQDQLFDVLREELLAQKIRLMAQTGVFPRSPAAAWDFFCRLNRQVKAELIPIKVAEFTDEVPDPSDAELTAFFDKHKDQYSVPYSPEPGFKRRRQMDFQFVRTDFNSFLEFELAKVTDQEIEDHYQTHKEDYRDKLTPDASDLEINPAQVQPGTDGPSPLDGASSSQLQDSGDAASPDTENEDEGVLPPDSTPLQPEEETSSQDGSSLFSVSSEGEQAEITASDLVLDPNAVVEPAETEEQTEEQTAEQTEDATAPKPDLTSPAAIDVAPNTESGNTETAAADAGSDSQTPVYRPLEQVRDQIRRDIAIPQAQSKMDEALSASRSEVERFYKSNLVWQLTLEGDRDPAKKPTPPDFTSLIAKYGGLTFGSTGMVDQISVQDHELGQVYEPSYSGMPISFADVAFGEEVDAYKSHVFPQQGFGDVKFLFWKVGDKEAFVPELDNIRAQVVTAWKMHEDRAVKLAIAAGQRYAQRVRDSGQTLAEVVAGEPGRTVLSTEEVSWMTTGSLSANTGGQVYLSPIAEVDGAGHAFREAMFRLRPGQTDVAVNQSQTIVYVVRLVSESPTEEVLRERFLESNASSLMIRGQANPVGYLARDEGDRVLSRWYQGILDEMGFQWARDPQGPKTRSE